MERHDLKGMAWEEVEALVKGLGEPPYRARQIMHWVFQKGVTEVEQMSTLPHTLRQRLQAHCYLSALRVVEMQSSRDGTEKWLLQLSDGERIESVLIADGHEASRLTLCLSTQVGCRLACRFCLTGRMGLRRNLSADEIVGQVLTVQRQVAPPRRITHLVLMGMGEPLDNYEPTVKALRLFISPHGLRFSPRRITLSTSGLIPQLRRFAGEGIPINLAISLHAATDELRARLMPIGKRYALDPLLALCRTYPLPHRQRLTFEYVLLKGVNDSLQDAKAVAQLLRGIRCKINLIPFNPFDGAPFQPPEPGQVEQFQQYLLQRQFTVTVRQARGLDIDAACGQLLTTSAIDFPLALSYNTSHLVATPRPEGAM